MEKIQDQYWLRQVLFRETIYFNKVVNLKIIKLNSLKLGLAEINSASSLLNLFGRIFVCCDDQYNLYELQNDQSWIQHNWANSPDLPKDPHERKKLKPDFESLLGPIEDNKTIILIPSGSKSNRTLALIFDLESNHFTPFDMSGFFNKLGKLVALINLEGSVIYGDNYLFMNRGVQADPSSIISVNPKSFNINSITKMDFGSIDGTPLHGSELCIFEDNLYALAVAEASSNSYDDGQILGSSIFKISLDTFQILDQWKFDKPIKTEGLCRWQNNWLVTTDPDGIGQSEFFSFEDDR